MDYKIIGCVPCGGKGVRLSLPFSKELLPQKNTNSYQPLIHHIVSKMLEAGTEKIVFVHGESFKEDIRLLYSDSKYIHVKQTNPSFAGALKDFYETISLDLNDKVLFGLPDTIFEGNPFHEMLELDGIVCGLFKTKEETKVDRLDTVTNCFQIKTEKKSNNSDYFWGVLKFDSADIKKMVEDKIFEETDEIGYIINSYNKKCVWGGKYIDLGTYENLNAYWAHF